MLVTREGESPRCTHIRMCYNEAPVLLEIPPALCPIPPPPPQGGLYILLCPLESCVLHLNPCLDKTSVSSVDQALRHLVGLRGVTRMYLASVSPVVT